MSGIEAAPGNTIVAVVGAGHVEGMTRWYQKPVDREALEQLPAKGKLGTILKWLVPAVILAAFAYGLTNREDRTFEEMLFAWVLPNSIMAGILTAIAGARLISVGCAIVASPITSLNPLLGAGMVVGLLEAWLRKPTVEDAENINRDVQSFRGLYRNAFTRVLLVAVFATIGSALGGWIGLTWVVKIVAT
jgi:pheromone shutdown protein TraB